jgi:exodeoxyribonuclease VII large subunit
MSLLPDEGTLTVAEVGRRIERALKRELPPSLWVRGEIHGISRPRTGHVHFDLTGEGCSLKVVLFAGFDRDRVNRSLGTGVRMTDGTEVRIKVEPRWFAPRGEVSLRMLAIDPAFTLGRLAEARETLLRQLAQEGLLRRQAALTLPDLPLRVGLVTSVGSAAHADVTRTLAAAGVGWQVVECHATVQGPEAPRSIVAALRAVSATGVDAVCLVRGGGARTDLAAFDADAVARAVALLDVPVLTGIGHETDTSIADEVAWRRFVTPTACAAFLVERAGAWRARRDDAFARCLAAASTAADRAERRLARHGERVASTAGRHLRASSARVDRAAERLARRPALVLDAAADALAHRSARVAAADPARLLARGWSITRDGDGRLVRAVADAPAGSTLRTTVSDGEIGSTVP